MEPFRQALRQAQMATDSMINHLAGVLGGDPDDNEPDDDFEEPVGPEDIEQDVDVEEPESSDEEDDEQEEEDEQLAELKEQAKEKVLEIAQGKVEEKMEEMQNKENEQKGSKKKTKKQNKRKNESGGQKKEPADAPVQQNMEDPDKSRSFKDQKSSEEKHKEKQSLANSPATSKTTLPGCVPEDGDDSGSGAEKQHENDPQPAKHKKTIEAPTQQEMDNHKVGSTKKAWPTKASARPVKERLKALKVIEIHQRGSRKYKVFAPNGGPTNKKTLLFSAKHTSSRAVQLAWLLSKLWKFIVQEGPSPLPWLTKKLFKCSAFRVDFYKPSKGGKTQSLSQMIISNLMPNEDQLAIEARGPRRFWAIFPCFNSCCRTWAKISDVTAGRQNRVILGELAEWNLCCNNFRMAVRSGKKDDKELFFLDGGDWGQNICIRSPVQCGVCEEINFDIKDSRNKVVGRVIKTQREGCCLNCNRDVYTMHFADVFEEENMVELKAVLISANMYAAHRIINRMKLCNCSWQQPFFDFIGDSLDGFEEVVEDGVEELVP